MLQLGEAGYFFLFISFILLVLLFDLGIFSRKDHKIGFTEASVWSAVWILLSLGFYYFILHFGHYIHGISTMDELLERIDRYQHPISVEGLQFSEALVVYEKNLALEYLTGYLIEKSLSVDNIFVILLIFLSFGVDERYYKRVLMWGILGALVMRFLFIFTGAFLVARFQWVLYLFGVNLLLTAIKMFIERNQTEKIDTERHPVVRFAARWFRVYPQFDGHRFLTRKGGRLMITPLLVVLLVIEFSDVIFAVDSIPAIFAVSRDPFIIFYSNIFAILGLRALFFLLVNVLTRFYYLKIGLSVLLAFIGVKMLLHHWLAQWGFRTVHSLYVIVGILAVSIIASMLHKPAENSEGES